VSQSRIDLDIPVKDALYETANLRRDDFNSLNSAEIDSMNKMLDLTSLGVIDRAHEHPVGPEVKEWRIGKICGQRLRNLHPESLQLAFFQIADTDRHTTTLRTALPVCNKRRRNSANLLHTYSQPVPSLPR
jgi:hypothetical protein